MAAVFAVLRARSRSDRRAYNLGFFAYWAGWCFAFPLWVLGWRRAVAVLRRGRPPTVAEAVLLVVPVIGGVATQLVPRRRDVDLATAAVMMSSAALNATGEELLWRGVFLEVFPEDVWRGAFWPLVGFACWHYAPQVILPSSMGRTRFVAGATLVGAAEAVTAWRGRGLRWVLLAHAATDACGVAAALFRQGR
jgi:membrane protease YdiL (CAAX protease family)